MAVPGEAPGSVLLSRIPTPRSCDYRDFTRTGAEAEASCGLFQALRPLAPVLSEKYKSGGALRGSFQQRETSDRRIES